MKRCLCDLVFCTIVVAACFPVCARGSKAKHAQDFMEVVNGYNDYRLKMFYEQFSSDIDKFSDAETSTSITACIKRLIAEKKNISVHDVHLHKHRYIAHQWPYQGAIPYEDLLLIDQDYPGLREDIISVWARFCRRQNDYIASEFAIQSAPWLSKAYCAILYYTHLLGDWLPYPENRDFEYVMPIDNIISGIEEAVGSMSRSEEHKKYCAEMKEELRKAKALGGASSQQQAVTILEALKRLKIGTRFHELKGVGGKRIMDESRHPFSEDEGQPALKKAA